MTYDDSHTVTLPLRDWLSVYCALWDAVNYNNENGYTATARDQQELMDRVIDNATQVALKQARASREAANEALAI